MDWSLELALVAVVGIKVRKPLLKVSNRYIHSRPDLLTLLDCLESSRLPDNFPIGISSPKKSVPSSAESVGNCPGTWRLKLPWGKHVLRIRPDLSCEIELEPFDEVRKVLDVSVIDNHVQFRFGIDKGGYETTISFEDKITGDNFTGECTTGGTEFPAEGVRI